MLVANPEVIIRLLRHPLRREILKHYIEKDEPLSPRQVARELRERLDNLGYHIRKLHTARALLLVDEQPVRGAKQHFYVHHRTLTDQPRVRRALELPNLSEEPGNDA